MYFNLWDIGKYDEIVLTWKGLTYFWSDHHLKNCNIYDLIYQMTVYKYMNTYNDIKVSLYS